MSTINSIIEELNREGYGVNLTKTLHRSGSSFYQIEHNGKIYPISRGNKQDIGQNAIISCYNSFGIAGVKNLFGID